MILRAGSSTGMEISAGFQQNGLKHLGIHILTQLKNCSGEKKLHRTIFSQTYSNFLYPGEKQGFQRSSPIVAAPQLLHIVVTGSATGSGTVCTSGYQQSFLVLHLSDGICKDF